MPRLALLLTRSHEIERAGIQRGSLSVGAPHIALLISLLRGLIPVASIARMVNAEEWLQSQVLPIAFRLLTRGINGEVQPAEVGGGDTVEHLTALTYQQRCRTEVLNAGTTARSVIHASLTGIFILQHLILQPSLRGLID